MQYNVATVEEYLNAIPQERRPYIEKIRKAVLDNLPEGFVEEMNYGMIGYVVPLSVYPDGYHTTPNTPLPFANIASQKNFIGFYHMGVYTDPELLKWWEDEYAKQCKYKLDMGKSCVRLKKFEDIPYDLIGELMQKMTAQDWIDVYESHWKK